MTTFDKVGLTVGLCITLVILFKLLLDMWHMVKYFEEKETAERRERYKRLGTDWSQFEQPARKPIIDPVKGMLPRGGEE